MKPQVRMETSSTWFAAISVTDLVWVSDDVEGSWGETLREVRRVEERSERREHELPRVVGHRDVRAVHAVHHPTNKAQPVIYGHFYYAVT